MLAQDLRLNGISSQRRVRWRQSVVRSGMLYMLPEVRDRQFELPSHWCKSNVIPWLRLYGSDCDATTCSFALLRRSENGRCPVRIV